MVPVRVKMSARCTVGKVVDFSGSVGRTLQRKGTFRGHVRDGEGPKGRKGGTCKVIPEVDTGLTLPP